MNHEDLNVAGGISFVGDSFQDDNGHGTNMAGLINAQFNDVGIKGIAPSADLYAVKVLDKHGQGSYSDIIAALDWAMDNNINIINMSFGGTEPSKALQEAIEKAWESGILIIAPSGNNGTESILYPAHFPAVMAIGSIDNEYKAASFSNYGSKLELVAPGSWISTTDINNKYTVKSGTSLSAAIVTAAAADIWSAHKDWDVKQLRASMLNSATFLGDKQYYGYGLIQPINAIQEKYKREVVLDTTGEPISTGNDSGTVIPLLTHAEIAPSTVLPGQQATLHYWFDDLPHPGFISVYDEHNNLVQESAFSSILNGYWTFKQTVPGHYRIEVNLIDDPNTDYDESQAYAIVYVTVSSGGIPPDATPDVTAAKRTLISGETTTVHFSYKGTFHNTYVKILDDSRNELRSSYFANVMSGDFIFSDTNEGDYIIQVIPDDSPASLTEIIISVIRRPSLTVELNKINSTTDSYYDDSYNPGEIVYFHLDIRGEATSADLYVDGAKQNSVLNQSQFLWFSPDDINDHEIKVIASGPGGAEDSAALRLYALVKTTGAVLSYLPFDKVENSPFHEDHIPSESPNATITEYYTYPQHSFRQLNQIILEGKSDGNRFVSTPRVLADRDITQSLYCDNEPSPTRQVNWQTEEVIPRDNYAYQYSVRSFLESRVSVNAPDIWDSIAKLADPSGAINGMIGNTGESHYIPSIFSTLEVQISADGQSSANWVDEKDGSHTVQSSYFPYHYAYLNGNLVGNYGSHPPIDIQKWSNTADAKLVQFLSKLKSETNIDANSFLSEVWFKGLRAECARQRLEKENKPAYDQLQGSVPLRQKLPWFNPIAMMAFKSEILPFFTKDGIRRGAPGNGIPWGSPGSAVPSDIDTCDYSGCTSLFQKFFGFKSPVDVHVYDVNGRHTGPLPDGSLEENIPGILYFIEDGHKYVQIPNSKNYRIEITGTDNGLVTIEEADFSGGKKLQFEQYYKLPVTPATKGIITMKDIGFKLGYDVKGSGTLTELEPTTIIQGDSIVSNDSTPPETTMLVNQLPVTSGQYYGPIDITLNATDNESGVQSSEYSLDGGVTWIPYHTILHLSEYNQYTILYRSKDYNNNMETTKSQFIRIDPDVTPPVTSIQILGDEGQPTYFRSSVKVILSAVDDTGVKNTEYSLNEGATWNNYTGPIVMANEQFYKLIYRSTDIVGNIEQAKLYIFVIDLTAPSSPSIVASTKEWTKDDVTVSINHGIDTLSGFYKSQYKLNADGVWTDYTGDFKITAEGQTVIYARTLDNSGNSSIEVTETIKIDRSPPTPATINLSTAEWTSSKVTFTITPGIDSGSGVQKTQYKIGDQNNWIDYTLSVPISPEGETTVYSKTIDNLGNESVITTAVAKIDRTPPSTPANVRASNKTATAITLSWDPSIDNTYIKGYEIYKDNIYIGYTASTTYTINNLVSKKTYSFTLKAIDSAKNSSNPTIPLVVTTN